MRQVFVNTESTTRQYALKERLNGLGWEDGMIEIIDCDLGRSGAETTGREGFRQMMADVGEEYRANLSVLLSNTTHDGASPPREGNSLIQGIAVCSRCGSKMFVGHYDPDYHQYICRHRQKGEPYTARNCLAINGSAVDAAVSDVVLRRLTPEAVKAASEVLNELEKRKRSEDGYFAMQAEKAKYEAELAKKRYMNADPENRLVCAELERLWKPWS
jgi:hypothetical protein